MYNVGAIDSAYNTSINQKNKHIGIAHHFDRDCILRGKVKLTHCDSSEQAADPLQNLYKEYCMKGFVRNNDLFEHHLQIDCSRGSVGILLQILNLRNQFQSNIHALINSYLVPSF